MSALWCVCVCVCARLCTFCKKEGVLASSFCICFWTQLGRGSIYKMKTYKLFYFLQSEHTLIQYLVLSLRSPLSTHVNQSRQSRAVELHIRHSFGSFLIHHLTYYFPKYLLLRLLKLSTAKWIGKKVSLMCLFKHSFVFPKALKKSLQGQNSSSCTLSHPHRECLVIFGDWTYPYPNSMS